MSTWLQDLEKTHPKLAQAFKVTGNQSRPHLQAMVKALRIHPALNTPEDNQRLEAAEYILKNNRKVQ